MGQEPSPPSGDHRPDHAAHPTPGTPYQRLKRVVFGAPKDVKDPHAFHKLSLVALLAWVGLGADGLSSSLVRPRRGVPRAGRAPSHRARRLPRRWRRR